MKKYNKKAPLASRIDLEAYPYAECREQHVWKFHDGEMDHKAGVAYRIQQCAQCMTKRHSILSLHHADFGQHVRPAYYTYPTDYRVAGGMDRADRGQLRMHNFLREIKQFKGYK